MNYKQQNYFKKIIFLTIVFTFSLFLTNCNKDKQPYLENAIALGYKDEIPYLINAKNEVYSLEKYDEVTNVFGDYLVVKLDGKYGYIDNTGKEIIKPTYDKAFLMKENKAVVVIDNNYHIIDNQGNIIYTFNENVFSSSYFSENFLIIETIKDHNHYFGYLKYDSETNSFSILNDEINFDYCAKFYNGYGIVGIAKDEKIKYTYLTPSGEYLFSDKVFDEARYFYDELACVGELKSVVISGKLSTQMVYKYIRVDGNYLTRNKKILEFQYASDFSDECAIVGDYYYSYSQLVYFKKYQIIDSVGNLILEDPLYYSGAGVENEGAPANFWPTNFIYYNDTYIFAVRTNGAYGSWNVKYHKDQSFLSIPMQFTEKDDAWLVEMSKILGVTSSSTSLAKNYSSAPYYMEALKISGYYSTEIPITCVRVFGSDNYGIIQVLIDEKNFSLSLSYLIPPIYEELFY